MLHVLICAAHLVWNVPSWNRSSDQLVVGCSLCGGRAGEREIEGLLPDKFPVADRLARTTRDRNDSFYDAEAFNRSIQPLRCELKKRQTRFGCSRPDLRR